MNIFAHHNHDHNNALHFPARDKAGGSARRASLTGFWANVSLGVAKILAGLFGHSSALVADGIHTFSDTFSDILIFFFVPMSRRKPDRRFSYGRGKIETLVSLVISLVLMVIGVGILVEATEAVIEVSRGVYPPRPGWIALIIAVVAIVTKECMFRYFRRVGRKIGSKAMEANAWHHRADALSSLATLIGIAGAMFFGESMRILDPIAAMIVGLLIFTMGSRLALPAIAEMLDMSLPRAEVMRIEDSLAEIPGIVGIGSVRSRRVGDRKALEVTLFVSGDTTIRAGEEIISSAERRIAEICGGQPLCTVALRSNN